ncbi:MAG: hypothetical protein QNI90_12225 [Dinoroseobacter sp.]|nr:hypothetical protein [Dinoroseobacter sp.]MDJ0994336.1 hypothetical protein [Dinoroseobacter sp.]
MSKFTTFLAAATAASLATGAIAPANAQGAMMNTGQQVQATQAGVHPTFAHFREPQLMTSLYDGDIRNTGKSKVDTMYYLMKIISVFDEPQVWYRIGQHADVALDPELAPVARGLIATNPELMRPMGQAGLQGVLGALVAMGKERRNQMNRGTFDPFAEIAAFNRGQIQHTSPFARLAANANHDAKNLMLLAQEDPDAFMQAYEGIRQFVYRY